MSLVNFTKTEIPSSKTISGKKEWVLLSDAGEASEGYSLFVKLLNKDKAPNTAKNYASHVAYFLDYIAEAKKISCFHGYEIFDTDFLLEVIDAYVTFLRNGKNQSNQFYNEIARSLNIQEKSKDTVIPHIAAINMFLSLSDSVEQRRSEALSSQANFLHPNERSREKINQFEKAKMHSNSMIASVLASGAKLKNQVRLSQPTSQQSTHLKNRDFPSNKFVELIDKGFSSYRDKAFYSLLGASGIRFCEARILTFKDLDIPNQTIKTIDPLSRPLSDFGGYFTTQELIDLGWKGREIDTALLIEPWGAMFWYYLDKYLTYEYSLTEKHTFIFQKNHHTVRSEPFCSADERSIRRTFTKVCAKLGIYDTSFMHSLRHMYGVFLKNYYPNLEGGLGLRDEKIKEIMGHKLLSSTLRYAKSDLGLMKTRHALALLMTCTPDELKVKATEEILLQHLKELRKLTNIDSTQESVFKNMLKGH